MKGIRLIKNEGRLIEIVTQSDITMARLRTIQSLGLDNWCIAAGAIRNLVWDHLHNYEEPSKLFDIDIAYFDSQNTSQEQDNKYQAQLEKLDPNSPWEVTNQAGVHLWYESYFGYAVEPLTSLEKAATTWPEFTTCVAIYLNKTDEVQVIAPYGLDDLFEMRIRRNPKRVSKEVFAERLITKNYAQRWPKVQISS